jgi:nucleotide-binding universal stress UspA family protein
MKNIIVPIDFSEESLHGLELALVFTKKQYTNIQMVYVQKKSSDYNSPGYFEEEHRWAEAKFKELVKKYSDYLQNDSKLRYIIKVGKIYREVVSQVESYKEGMVVASTHGASGFEEFFLGSNAFKIIEATTRPVMIIRKKHIPEDIKKIVLPIDVTIDTRQKVPYTVEMAQLFGSEIHVITITTSQSKKINNRLAAYSKQVTNYLDVKKIPYKAKSLFGEALADLIVIYADSVDADLISIMKEQTKSINISGNLTHEILNRATTPVLCMTARETHIATGFRTFGG